MYEYFSQQEGMYCRKLEGWKNKKEYWEIIPVGTAIISRAEVVVRTYKIRGKHVWCHMNLMQYLEL